MDYYEDYLLLQCIHSYLAQPFFALDIIHMFKRHPEFLNINRMPEITVYITNYNLGKYLQDAIDSVLAQEFLDYELIIIDDCSNEKLSHEVIKKYSLHPRIKTIWNEKNIGLPACRNKALGMARGKYVMGLDADDALMPEALRKTKDWLDSNSTFGAVYCGYLRTNENLECLEQVNENNDRHPSGTLINKRCWNEVKYNEQLDAWESLEFYKRFVKWFKIGMIKYPLWFKRDIPSSMSNTKLDYRKEKLKEIEKI